MTLQEKLDLEKPTDEQQSAVIRLYKEGKFYNAADWVIMFRNYSTK